MSKIYVVTTGEYSDYSVQGVYSTPEKAKIAKSLYVGDIAEFELDEMPRHPKGRLRFDINFQKTGSIQIHLKDATDTYYGPWMDPHGTLNIPVYHLVIWAKDEAHALRRAAERRARMITSGIWQGEVERAKRRGVRREDRMQRLMKNPSKQFRKEAARLGIKIENGGKVIRDE